jgi:DNA-binding CsgD family transcriptional regulator
MNATLPGPVTSNFLGILEEMRCGGFCLDSRGRVVWLNTFARGHLGDTLLLKNDHLSAVDRKIDRQLQRVIDELLHQHGPCGKTPVILPRPARLPLIIQTFRLNEYAAQSTDAASVLLVARDAELWPEPSCDMLSQSFGLTRTEAEVAIGIASGKALVKIAADRGVKIGTVRAHLKAVFSKTHTRSQADLMRLLTRFSFLVPSSDRRSQQAVPVASHQQKLLSAG